MHVARALHLVYAVLEDRMPVGRICSRVMACDPTACLLDVQVLIETNLLSTGSIFLPELPRTSYRHYWYHQ